MRWELELAQTFAEELEVAWVECEPDHRTAERAGLIRRDVDLQEGNFGDAVGSVVYLDLALGIRRRRGLSA